MIRRRTTKQCAHLVPIPKKTFHISPTLRGSYNVAEVISPSGGKGKGNHCAIPACYLVLNGVTVYTTSPGESEGWSTCK